MKINLCSKLAYKYGELFSPDLEIGYSTQQLYSIHCRTAVYSDNNAQLAIYLSLSLVLGYLAECGHSVLNHTIPPSQSASDLFSACTSCFFFYYELFETLVASLIQFNFSTYNLPFSFNLKHGRYVKQSPRTSPNCAIINLKSTYVYRLYLS